MMTHQNRLNYAEKANKHQDCKYSYTKSYNFAITQHQLNKMIPQELGPPAHRKTLKAQDICSIRFKIWAV